VDPAKNKKRRLIDLLRTLMFIKRQLMSRFSIVSIVGVNELT